MGFLLTQTKHSTSSWDYESIILENVEKSSDTALWQKTNNENRTQLSWVVPTACSTLVKPYSDSETPLAVRLFNLG